MNKFIQYTLGDRLECSLDNQSLFKIMSIEHLLSSISESYLYFNRVDAYEDFPGADQCDGEQLQMDRTGNESSRFEKNPDFSWADHCDRSRQRTYASCFSVEDSDYIWKNYGGNDPTKKIGVIFNFGKLRETVVGHFESEEPKLLYNEQICHQIFDLYFGLAKYVDRSTYQANNDRLLNAAEYAFFKDIEYSDDKELRIALVVQQFAEIFLLNNGAELDFSNQLQLSFDWRIAFDSYAGLIYGPKTDRDLVNRELEKMNIKSLDADTKI